MKLSDLQVRWTLKKSTQRDIIIKLIKAKEKESWKQEGRSDSPSTRYPQYGCQQMSYQNFGGQKAGGQYIQSDKRKNLPIKILYLVKLSFKIRDKLRHCQINESWRNLFLIDLSTRNALGNPQGGMKGH